MGEKGIINRKAESIFIAYAEENSSKNKLSIDALWLNETYNIPYCKKTISLINALYQTIRADMWTDFDTSPGIRSHYVPGRVYSGLEICSYFWSVQWVFKSEERLVAMMKKKRENLKHLTEICTKDYPHKTNLPEWICCWNEMPIFFSGSSRVRVQVRGKIGCYDEEEEEKFWP